MLFRDFLADSTNCFLCSILRYSFNVRPILKITATVYNTQTVVHRIFNKKSRNSAKLVTYKALIWQRCSTKKAGNSKFVLNFLLFYQLMKSHSVAR